MNLLSKRSIAVCLSTTESAYQQMLHDQIECNTIYSTKYENGTLYGMLLMKAKTHKTLDNAISRLDTLLKNSDRGTRFVSISNVLGCKVKTFAKGEHATDEHFKALFISNNPYIAYQNAIASREFLKRSFSASVETVGPQTNKKITIVEIDNLRNTLQRELEVWQQLQNKVLQH